jgi:F-type H+-transporting ATPase subunit delta
MVDGVLSDERIRLVAGKLMAEKAAGLLQTLQAFERLVRLEKARRHAIVESATESTPALRDAILADLKAKYGADVTAEFAVTPGLIGGLRVKLGSDVYDGSVRARLDRLAESVSL